MSEPDEVDARGVYDAMAEVYAADADNPYNALYERPAMLGLLGRVEACRALDAGCGPGALARELVARGARVTGVDVSPRMVALARSGVPGGTFLVADLAAGLPFAAGSFDVVAASLSLHYVRDWEPVLREFARVLVDGGRVVLSTHHPEMVAALWPDVADPDALAVVDDEWHKGGRAWHVRFWRRGFGAMEAAFAASGLTLERWVSPEPLDECREVAPDAWARLAGGRPWFAFAVLSAPGGSPSSRSRG